ncbi:hypothetical protein [uncultured Jatrophihabitans sp.]|uniref:hypothetical protein n=1 Tax=uncultured Jatrophihabitans sp. TaxID=1610747 RepID=UPI0035CB0BEC
MGVAVLLPPGRGNVVVGDGVGEGVIDVEVVGPGVVDVGVGVADLLFSVDEELVDDDGVADDVADFGLVGLGVGVGVECVVRCGASWLAEIGRIRK